MTLDRSHLELSAVPDWLQLLAEMWHRTFGKVKCHMTRCPVCADTDWPPASWVQR